MLAWYSLTHFPPEDLSAVLDELRRVLVPGGSLLLGFFDGPAGERFPHAVTDAFCSSTDAMAGALQTSGFEVVHTETRQDAGKRPHAAIIAIAR